MPSYRILPPTPWRQHPDAVVVPGRDRSGTVIARTTTTAEPLHTRHVGDDDSAALDVGMNLNMLLVGVDDGVVTTEQNVGDEMAMGAPPGVPGNMDMCVVSVSVSEETMSVPK